MKNGRILIVEDDRSSRENLRELLVATGYETTATDDGQKALDLFQQNRFDLVITDLILPHMDGLELLKRLKELDNDNMVILITGHGSIDNAVEAMKQGAFDYITKPLIGDLLLLRINQALAYVNLRMENQALRHTLHDNYDFGNLIGYSDCMKNVFQTIGKVAATDSTVVIYGESGTGKELVARAIHLNSERKTRPLVAVNCAAIPEDLLESELFGHEKGAFTGAIRTRMGRFEQAQGGTIFLDEIGDMCPALQVKILRVIQEKHFERIGGVKTIIADARIITATNQDLEKAVVEKRFREDLYYRINVIPIYLPPLRERGQDVEILAHHFLKKFNLLKRKNISGINPVAMSKLIHYPWPGNVRELENMMERLVVMNEDTEIRLEHLPLKIQNNQPDTTIYTKESPATGTSYNELVTNFEKELLLKALKKSNGIKNQAAKLLNLNRTTLIEKLKRFNIDGR